MGLLSATVYPTNETDLAIKTCMIHTDHGYDGAMAKNCQFQQ